MIKTVLVRYFGLRAIFFKIKSKLLSTPKSVVLKILTSFTMKDNKTAKSNEFAFDGNTIVPF